MERILFDAGGASRVTVCRRRTTGAGEDADDADDEDVVVVVVVVLVWALVEEVLVLALRGELEGETGMPKGVSSSFILEEDATFPVAGRTRG